MKNEHEPAQPQRIEPRIYTRCPACFNDTLTINKGRLLCTWHECPNPTLIDSSQPASGAASEDAKWQKVFEGWSRTNQGIIDSKNKELAAERGRRKTLEQQLLAAQAAIEKHNKQWNCSWAGEIKPDLSALREHDAEVIEHDRFNRRDVLGWEQGYKCAKAEAAEVRRRLVDLLRLVAAHMRAHVTNEPLRKEVEAALAQVKEGK